MKRKVLVTGADGLLGFEFISKFNTQFDIVALCRKEPLVKFDGVEYLMVDLSRNDFISLLPKQVDIILHLAQSSLFRDFPNSANDVFSVNIASTAGLLNYAYLVKPIKFIYVSSGGIYGANKIPFSENSFVQAKGNLGYYLSSKLCAEILVGNYSDFFQTHIARPFFIYGDRQDCSMLIPRLVSSVENSKAISLQGKEGIRINPIHVSDAARALNLIINYNGDLPHINIAGDQVLSLRQIAKTIGMIIGKNPIFDPQASKANDVIGDITLLESLGMSFELGFEENIKSLCRIKKPIV
jgi:UDP-glucose 4-epimerase